ncbi:hypothetical protein KFL_000280310 [Klebsormidium nitens]|uniref:Carbohydrate binding module family 25 domain-containing protein n=1 Tax=Klebsormidium nitens TaxID=105231 RepID=A0A1Y1HRX1_KLENI|nr:hypothetical protein KFL_000280310 [Klebsormidium nitens]|eukprot:GAQ79326.1 hypothetical protein KFL_000280310 [Klebsormidium nitens]
METMRRAHCCSALNEHVSFKISPSVQVLQAPGIACGTSKPPSSVLRPQKDALSGYRLKQTELTGTFPRVRARSSGPHSATLASQVQPRIGGPPVRKSSKGVSTAQDKKSKESEGDDAHAQIRALISRISQVRLGWGQNGDAGNQPSTEVREKSEGLLHRLVSLQHFAEQHSWPDGELPVQVVATMRALSRELGSLENIVRLANDSGATVTRSRGSPGSLVPSSFPSKAPLPVVAVNNRRKLQTTRSQEVQHEAVKGGQGEEEGGFHRSPDSQSSSSRSVEGSEYAVSAPAGKGASPLAAFRKEIERRVIEQLSSKLELPAPVKVDRSMGPVMPAGTVQAPSEQRQPWTEQDDWAWSGESILDTGLADRRKAEFDLGPSENVRAESSYSASTSGSESWKHQQYVKGTEIIRQQKIKAMEDEVRTAESERLKLELHRMEAELKSAESSTGRVRIKELESKVRQLELELSRSVPLSIHDEVVKKLQGTVSELRGRIRELEGFVRERESMITVVSNNLIAERDVVVKKLTAELSKRVTTDEVERAVASAVDSVRAELSHAQNEVRQFASALERREEELQERMHAWEGEKRAVNDELEATIKRMVAVEATVDARRAEVLQEQVRAVELERELARLMEERSTFMAGAVQEKEALLLQVAMLESSLTESERQAGGCLQQLPGSALTKSEVEPLSGRQDAAEDVVQLERVRLELKSLMKVAEAGQVALLVKKIADLLVSISKEGGASGPPAEWGAAVAANGEITTNGAVFPAVVGGSLVGGRAGSNVEQSLLSAVGASVNGGRAAADVDEYDSEGSDGGYETEELDEAAPVEKQAAPVEVPPPAEKAGGPVETEVAPPEEEDESAQTEPPARVERPPSEETETPAAPAEAPEEVYDEDDVKGGVELAPEAGPGLQVETSTERDGEGGEDTPTITFYYETGWETAYVHCSADGQSWTEPPGLQMTDAVSPAGVQVKMLEIPATSLEFVLTNGGGDWDQPGHGGNYHIDHAGTFTLLSGSLTEG